MLVEGVREAGRALENGVKPRALLYAPDLFSGTEAAKVVESCHHAEVELLECTRAVFQKRSDRENPDGIILLAPYLDRALEDLALPAKPLLLVAVGIEKPGNLGAMLRTADAAGVDAVIVCDGVTDLHNPNTIRASTGAMFTLPVVECSGEQLKPWLATRGLRTVAATPQAEKVHFQADFTGALAVLVGSEDTGLDESWMNTADLRVKIPMLGRADSLNAATAGALLLYEAVRQRNYPGS
jgi:TrmH family RNA methyltransferase